MFRNDYAFLWSQIQHEEKICKAKRRWLMGMMTKRKSGHADRRIPKILKNKLMCESFLRKEDVSYDIIRIAVERGFETYTDKKDNYVVQNYMYLFDLDAAADKHSCLSNILMVISTILDDLTNEALFHLANTVKKNSIPFEKTRPKMKAIFKQYIIDFLEEISPDDCNNQLLRLSQLLKNPTSFRENTVTLLPLVSPCLLLATNMIMGKLNDMCIHTLRAMRRRLKNLKRVPSLHLVSTFNKARLVQYIGSTCNMILSEYQDGDMFPIRVAKALELASLYMKEIKGNVDCPLPDFFYFNPGIKSLQKDIIKAIKTLPKIKIDNLIDLGTLLNIKHELPRKKLRRAIRRLLCDCLYECGEVGVPNFLPNVLSFINNCSHVEAPVYFSKDVIDEEVESILCLSSQMKQMISDSFYCPNIEQDYGDAYLENFDSTVDVVNQDEVSDFELNHGFKKQNCLSDSGVESIGETLSTSFVADKEKLETHNGKHHHGQHSFSFPIHPEAEESSCKNMYLDIQNNCDKTSLIVYQLVGNILEEFSHIEGIKLSKRKISYLRGQSILHPDMEGSSEIKTSLKREVAEVVLQTVKTLMSSFPESAATKVGALLQVTGQG